MTANEIQIFLWTIVILIQGAILVSTIFPKK